MSLKAKIEAVIYASEEPVTLAQLTGLLGEEAQTELNALESQQQSLALGEDSAASPETAGPEAEAGDPDALNAELLGQPEDPTASEAPAAVESEVASEAATSDRMPEPAFAVDEKKLTRERERKLRDYFRSLLDELIRDYAAGDRGLEIREVAGGFRLATKPEYHDAVRGFVKSLKPPLKLSLQALETLAVIAYKQPVTAPEISEIRGVDSGGVIGSLMTRKLVTTAGRKQVIGRPILYKTTKDFLLRFGLKDINELPSIEEFEKMASELADGEPVQEEIPMETQPQHHAEGPAAGSGSPSGSPSLDELNSAPEPTTALHETPEEMLGDDSSQPEGSDREHRDPHEVEPMAEMHSPQADGDSTDEDAGVDPADNTVDDTIIDGRISGPPPSYADDVTDDPSAIGAEIQSNEKVGGA